MPGIMTSSRTRSNDRLCDQVQGLLPVGRGIDGDSRAVAADAITRRDWRVVVHDQEDDSSGRRSPRRFRAWNCDSSLVRFGLRARDGDRYIPRSACRIASICASSLGNSIGLVW